MKTKIISAFPGLGKTYYHAKHPSVTLDSDSSNFSWIKDKDGNNTKERNHKFPGNYLDHIVSNIGKYEYIFVSSHKEVRDVLLDNCIFFYILYPHISRKEEFLKRYSERGSPDGFVELVSNNWCNWIEEIQNSWDPSRKGPGSGCEKICIMGNLEDALPI